MNMITTKRNNNLCLVHFQLKTCRYFIVHDSHKNPAIYISFLFLFQALFGASYSKAWTLFHISGSDFVRTVYRLHYHYLLS